MSNFEPHEENVAVPVRPPLGIEKLEKQAPSLAILDIALQLGKLPINLLLCRHLLHHPLGLRGGINLGCQLRVLLTGLAELLRHRIHRALGGLRRGIKLGRQLPDLLTELLRLRMEDICCRPEHHHRDHEAEDNQLPCLGCMRSFLTLEVPCLGLAELLIDPLLGRHLLELSFGGYLLHHGLYVGSGISLELAQLLIDLLHFGGHLLRHSLHTLRSRLTLIIQALFHGPHL
mmetsp:Transcript_39486/g.91173  ORF Transcript_39486/g.91173 Transcript_39486/m.91173 type:complete len:231 (+) Transcript_39486:492-1184(+)